MAISLSREHRGAKKFVKCLIVLHNSPYPVRGRIANNEQGISNDEVGSEILYWF
jgi:hypothetical protein